MNLRFTGAMRERIRSSLINTHGKTSFGPPARRVSRPGTRDPKNHPKGVAVDSPFVPAGNGALVLKPPSTSSAPLSWLSWSADTVNITILEENILNDNKASNGGAITPEENVRKVQTLVYCEPLR
jgi:hypothetical protein